MKFSGMQWIMENEFHSFIKQKTQLHTVLSKHTFWLPIVLIWLKVQVEASIQT